jgi:hypothetical protein
MRRNAERDGLSVTGEAFIDRFAALAALGICDSDAAIYQKEIDK